MPPLFLALLLQAPSQDVQVSGHAGFGGVVERGEWTPLTIDLDHRGKEDVDLILSVVWAQSSGVQESDKPTLGSIYGKTGPVHRLPVSMAARSRKRLSLGLRAPRADRLSAWVFAESAGTGRTLAAGELLARSLPARQRLVVVVGADRLDGFPGFATQAAPEHLPEDWRAYASVDTLVWLDARASDFRSQAQVDALRTWICFGGRFILARASEIGLGTPIAEFLPVSLKGARSLPSLAALAQAGGSAPEGRAMVLESLPERGTVRLAQDGVPLVVEGLLGAGRTIFVAFDPSKEPIAGWAGAGRFWSWLAPTRPPADPPGDFAGPPESIGAMSLALHVGTFPDVAPPAIGGLFILIVIYLVVVGPFDYFLLRKFQRLELTWITFPSYVVLFTLLILLAGGAFIERSAYQRELLVVDRAAGSPVERRRALSAVLAPRNQRYAVKDAEPVSSNYLASQISALDLGNAVLARSPEISLRDWTVSRGATGLAAADRAVPSRGSLSWIQDEGLLRTKNDTGSVVRPSILLTPGGVYAVDSIPSGDTQVRLTRKAGSMKEYLSAEGAHSAPERDEFQDPMGLPRPWSGERAVSPSVKEQILDTQLRRVLLSLSFDAKPRASTGFARSLDVGPWLESGGSLLLAWEKPGKADVEFDPLPNRYTGLAMIRYFQGPSK